MVPRGAAPVLDALAGAAGCAEAALILQARRPDGMDGLRMIALMDEVNAGVHKRVAHLLSSAVCASVLEVGFGGLGLRRKLPCWVVDYTGVDWSATAVRQAALSGLPGRFVHAPVHALPFEDALFDTVLAVNTIYWWPDLQAGLREIKRVLRPGAPLVVGAVLLQRDGGSRLADAVHAAGAHHYTVPEVFDALISAGFEVENDQEIFVDRIELQGQVHYRDYALFLAYKSESRRQGDRIP